MSENLDFCKKRSVSFADSSEVIKPRCLPTFGSLNEGEHGKVVILGATGACVFRLVHTMLVRNNTGDFADVSHSSFVEDYHSFVSESGKNLEIVATCGLDSLLGNRSLARWSEIADAIIFIFSSAVDSNLQIELLQEVFLLPSTRPRRLCVLLDSGILAESERDLCESLSALTHNWLLLRGELGQAINSSLTDNRTPPASPLSVASDVNRPRKSPLLLPILSRGKVRSDTIDTSATLATLSNSCIAPTFRGS